MQPRDKNKLGQSQKKKIKKTKGRKKRKRQNDKNDKKTKREDGNSSRRGTKTCFHHSFSGAAPLGGNDDTSIVKVSIGFKTSGLPAIGLPTRRQSRGKEF